MASSSVIRRLLHWGPICALSVVFICFSASIICLLEWWPPIASVYGSVNFFVFCFWTCLTLTNFLTAVHLGPGEVPSGWKPVRSVQSHLISGSSVEYLFQANPSDEQFLQFCQICSSFKAPRSHHCRKCGRLEMSKPTAVSSFLHSSIFFIFRCVLKMDHHCPWINTCCGHRNQPNFIKFLFWAVIGCIHATFILAPSIYRGLFRVKSFFDDYAGCNKTD